jgi:hypothetical protein
MNDVFLDVVTRALNYLYDKGRLGYWSDPRTTSEVVLALVASGETAQSEYLNAAGQYLVSQFTPEAVGGSWGSELWDTSVVVKALYHLAANSSNKCNQAFEWIATKRFTDGSFDGEPWDTLFVAQAALQAGRREQLLGWRTVDWLCGIQTDNGALISPHYTGIFLEVVAGAVAGELEHARRGSFEEAKTKALMYLADTFHGTELWGGVSWTNAYVLNGISACRHKRLLLRFPEFVKWFETKQEEDGAWEDVVRTAIVVQSLCRLKIAYEIATFDPLQPLDRDVYVQTAEASLGRAIQVRVFRPPLLLNRPLISRDKASGNVVITVTPQRERYFGIIISLLGAAWAIAKNWSSLRWLLGR